MDLQRKQSLPANKLATLMTKFDEVKSSGNMMPTATLAMGTMEGEFLLKITSDLIIYRKNIVCEI